MIENNFYATVSSDIIHGILAACAAFSASILIAWAAFLASISLL